MLFDGDRTTTFAQYKDMVEHAAAGLHALGIGAGDHVSWQLPTWTESAVLVGALCRLGAIQNPMLPIYRHREVSFIAAQTKCKLLITPSTWNKFGYAALAEQVAGECDGMNTLVADRWNPDGDAASLPPPADANDLVRWIFYTSGTTADPKGAQHTDRSALAGAIGYAEKTHVTADDIALVAFPFTHIGGIIIGVFTPLLTGSAAVLMEAWTPAASTELIAEHRITLGNGAPAIHAALLAEARGEPRGVQDDPRVPVGRIDEAAAPARRADRRGAGMRRHHVRLRHDRGADRQPDRHRCSRRIEARGEGTPTRGVTMTVLDNGELAVKGPQVMRGYVDSSLDGDAFTDDGWLRTGDMARFDEHGAIIITGRIKDIIIRKGENVSAKEVEDVLYTHPKVADVAVLGIPDEDRGEMVVAFVVPKDAGDPPTVLDVREHCTSAGLMVQKIPERIELIDAMPRNPSGKVPKHQLRAGIT